MPTSKPPTVRSLAAELGVAPITVSRALRGHDSVRPALAGRIQRHADKRGYRRDALVSEVMGTLGRATGARYRETVAFVWTHRDASARDEERGAMSAAAELGYRLESIRPWTQNLSPEDVARILWARGVRGVLLTPNNSRPDPRYDLPWERFAAVLLGSSLVNEGLTRVTRDYYHDMRLAVTRMRGSGAKRLGLVLDQSTHERTERRYVAAFVEYGGPAGRVHLVDQGGDRKRERERFGLWLARARPDALLIEGVREPSWMPEGVPVGRLMLNAGERGPGVRADFGRVGGEGMRALDGLLRSGRLGLLREPASILIPGAWVG